MPSGPPKPVSDILSDEAEVIAVPIKPPSYDPRIHDPPVYFSSFWDFPGRRPQVCAPASPFLKNV